MQYKEREDLMTIDAFEKLKIGDFVRSRENQLFIVKDDYVWGPPCKVYLVEIVDNILMKQCQISLDNYHYWEVVGK